MESSYEETSDSEEQYSQFCFSSDYGEQFPNLHSELIDLTHTSEEEATPRSISKKRKAQTSGQGPTQGQKSAAWCFTWNNPTETGDDFSARLQGTPGIRFGVFQLEKGEGGTPHYQGYLYFPKGKAFNTLINQIGQMHWSIARTDAQSNIRYCTKCCDTCHTAKRVGDCPDVARLAGPWTFGEPPAQGKRNDLAAVVKRIKEGASTMEIANEYPDVYLKNPKNVITAQQQLCVPSLDFPRVARLSIGITRVGKTWDATRIPGTSEPDEEVWIKKDTKWCDSYMGQKKVVWDDFAGAASQVTLTSLLQSLDNYRDLRETKGSHVWWMAQEIWFTTNIHPFLWYEWKNRRAQLDALAARFVEVRIYYARSSYNSLTSQEEITDFFRDPVKYGYSDIREI